MPEKAYTIKKAETCNAKYCPTVERLKRVVKQYEDMMDDVPAGNCIHDHLGKCERLNELTNKAKGKCS